MLIAAIEQMKWKRESDAILAGEMAKPSSSVSCNIVYQIHVDIPGQIVNYYCIMS